MAWKIKVKPHRLYGETRRLTTRITISDRQSEASARDSAIHEALHALLWTAGAGKLIPAISEEADEEALVRLLSPWLLGLIRDNPAFIEFILGEGI